MKRVELRVRHLMARRAFKAGAFEARFDEVDTDGIPTGTVAFTTRGHETWAAAASAAIKKADRLAWDVVNRGLVMRKIAAYSEGWCHQNQLSPLAQHAVVVGALGHRWTVDGARVRGASRSPSRAVKTPAELDAEIAEALGARKTTAPQLKMPRRELTKVIDPKDLCAYCGKPTRKGSMLLDEGQTAHRSCYKEFEKG